MRILYLSRSTLFSQPGGDTVQMEESARALRELGIFVDIRLKGDKIDFKEYQLVHFFNIGRPADLIPYLSLIKTPILISSIWVQYKQPSRIDSALEYGKVIGRWAKGTDKYPGWKYLYFGQKRSISILAHRAKQILTTTQKEADRIKELLDPRTDPMVVPPGLNESLTSTFEPLERSGLLTIGRIEKLKNQIVAIEAANHLNDELTVIGNPATNQPEYYQKCILLAKDNITFKPYQDAHSLLSEYRKAEILILPSLFETFGLVALEAWSQGCKLVLSNKIESASVFKDKALFFDPDNPQDLIEKVRLAKEQTQPDIPAEEAENWRWSNVAERLKKIYENNI